MVQVLDDFGGGYEVVTPMLDLWIKKGKIKKLDNNLGCAKGCCKCDPTMIVSYEWIGG